MSATNRIRWYGPPAILAGLLYAAGFPGSNEVIPGISHVAGHALFAAAGLGWLIGLEGVCRRDNGQLGRVGKAGITLGQIAALLVFAGNGVEAIWEHQFEIASAVTMLGLLGVVAGLILVGIGARRGHAMPDWASLAVVIAPVVFFLLFIGGAAVFMSGENPQATPAGNAPLTALLYILAVVFAIPWVAMGFMVWSSAGEAQAARQPQGL